MEEKNGRERREKINSIHWSKRPERERERVRIKEEGKRESEREEKKVREGRGWVEKKQQEESRVEGDVNREKGRELRRASYPIKTVGKVGGGEGMMKGGDGVGLSSVGGWVGVGRGEGVGDKRRSVGW